MSTIGHGLYIPEQYGVWISSGTVQSISTITKSQLLNTTPTFPLEEFQFHFHKHVCYVNVHSIITKSIIVLLEIRHLLSSIVRKYLPAPHHILVTVVTRQYHPRVPIV